MTWSTLRKGKRTPRAKGVVVAKMWVSIAADLAGGFGSNDHAIVQLDPENKRVRLVPTKDQTEGYKVTRAEGADAVRIASTRVTRAICETLGVEPGPVESEWLAKNTALQLTPAAAEQR